MKITTLIENMLGDIEGLHIEHGLSIFIEADNKKMLFDTGQSGNIVENAEKLGIDLSGLNYVFISHGHYDHSGGLERLIKEVKPNFDLYVGDGFFNNKYSLREDGDYQFTGNPFDVEFLRNNNIPTHYVNEDIIYLTENIMVFTNFNRKEEFENTNQTMYLKQDGEYIKDKFLDEISLGINTDKGLVVIVGCSHVGILNIIDTIEDRTGLEIYALIGGTHLVKEDDEKINGIIQYLREKEIHLIGACHCTGKQGETMLEQQLEENFINNNTGSILVI